MANVSDPYARLPYPARRKNVTNESMFLHTDRLHGRLWVTVFVLVCVCVFVWVCAFVYGGV